MPSDFQRLLAAYHWLQDEKCSAQGPHRAAMTAQIDEELDRLFLSIVRHPSKWPAVSAVQIEFVIGQLAGLARDHEQAKALADICRGHIETMARAGRPAHAATAAPQPRALAEQASRYIDSVSDRIGIIDRRYRYVMTNKQNADFHRREPSDFVGRPVWQVVSEGYFDRLMRPSLDRCFGGERISYTFSVNARGREMQFWLIMNPMRDDTNKITGAALTARELTDLDMSRPHLVSGRP